MKSFAPKGRWDAHLSNFFAQSKFFSTLLLGLLLAGCGPRTELSDGVELVMSSAPPSPAMTFELRFDQAMAANGQIGVPATNSALLFEPPLAGKFTWLSARSATFTPSEPLALDTLYVLSLRPGLKAADGQPAKVSMRRTLRTPPFGLVASLPRTTNSNAFSEPEAKLVFNLDVRASDAESFIGFMDAMGRQIPAKVRQGTSEERPWAYQFGGEVSLLTWAQQFAESTTAHAQHGGRRAGPVEESTNDVPNLLIARPGRPLPIGNGWKLVMRAGLPAAAGKWRLKQQNSVPIGDVTPFTVTGVTPRNVINAGPSIHVAFSKALPESLTNGWERFVEITPAVSDLSAFFFERGFTLQGDFKSDTAYTVKLRAGLPSSEPFELANDAQFPLVMPRVPPRLYFPAFSQDQMAVGNRTFPLLIVNVPRVRLRAKLLQPQTAIHALRGYQSYYRPWEQRSSPDEPYKGLDYNLVAGRTILDKEMPGTTQLDEAQTLNLSWNNILAGRKCGVVLLEARAAQWSSGAASMPGVQAVIQLTDLGLIWKRCQSGVEAFVFSHDTGRALTNANVWLFSDENEILRQATTDTNGIARLAATTNAGWLAAGSDEDFHAVALQDGGIAPWNYDLPFTGSDQTENRRKVMLFSDRNLYRPGEVMHLKALVRDWGEAGWSVPSALTGTLACMEAQGKVFLRTNVAFSASGSWSIDVPLPSGSRGGYRVQMHLGTQDYTHTFHVQDFQPNAFEIGLAAKPAFPATEPVRLPVSARYYFGKPLSRAQVKWSLEAEDTEFRPERFEEFVFQRTRYESRFARGTSSFALEGQGMLSASSNFVIAPELAINPAAPQPRAASLLVEVTDLNQQTLTRQVDFTKHSSDWYLGLRRAAEVFTAGKPIQLEAVVVGAKGKPWPETVQAHLKLQRVDWQTVRVKGAGRSVRYHNEAVLTNCIEHDIQLNPMSLPSKPGEQVRGQALPDLAVSDAGEYVLELTGKDSGGREVASSLDFTVTSSGRLAWDYRNDVQLKLRAEQSEYAPGQTATILIEAPFNGLALVSVEREKVLRSFVTRLEGNAPSIQVPLERGDVPNVYVNVTLLRGSHDCPREVKEPEYRLGYCSLAVLDPATRLAVAVSTGATNYVPGELVEVTGQVKDHAGSPVSNAEVTLYAVDEGVLSLTDSGLPNPYDFFYAPRMLGVQSCVSLPHLLSEDLENLSFQNKGYLGGGGGMERLRKRFPACAFWQATLQTDSAGKLQAKFAAPDGMTRYKVFAVAHHGNGQFGSGQAVFQISKPLVIEPALPQFANISDHLLARAVVQNQTDRSGDVLVSLELDETARAVGPGEPLSRRIAVSARGSAVVEFPLECVQAGSARWTWRARFAEQSDTFVDAVQSTLEVGYVAPLLREISLSRIAGAQTNLLSGFNPQLLAGQGTATITLANTRLSELGEAVSRLLHYPYGCAEQTGSSLLPWVLLRDEPALRSLANCATNDFDTPIRIGLARFWSMQTASGGLGYWPGDREPMPWASAYGGLVLGLARRHGVDIPEPEFKRLLDYLGEQLRSIDDHTVLSDACLALYALALADRAEPAYQERLFALREKLSGEDRALLALAILESHGPAATAGELLQTNSVSASSEPYRFGCPAREKAIRLMAWVRYDQASSMVDRLVTDLMHDQQQAHWGTTQGDAWALLALADYSRRVEGKRETIKGRLLWGGTAVAFEVNQGSNVFVQRLSITNAGSAPMVLVNDTSNRLFVSTCLEVRAPAAQQPRQDRGFSLARAYQRMDDENRLQDMQGLRVGDRVLVTMRLTVHAQAQFVAIDDALPSILEILNPTFKTQQVPEAPRSAFLDDGYWPADFHEIRKDRFLSFANWVPPGQYTLHYVARVRAAGTVTAPSAKAEEMYHPDCYGLTETQTISSQPWD